MMMKRQTAEPSQRSRPLVVGVDVPEAPANSTRKTVGDREICWTDELWVQQEALPRHGFTTPFAKKNAGSGGSAAAPADLDAEIASIEVEYNKVRAEADDLRKQFDERELQDHMTLLHEYNEIKDVGQILLGRLAEIRATTTKALYPEFGLDVND